MNENVKNSLKRDMDTKKFEIYDKIIDNIDDISNISEVITQVDKQIKIDSDKLINKDKK